MTELEIYDSQGNPLDERNDRVNDRIQGFFFDGVRMTVDITGNGIEIICFFRARDSEASRSEQYYARFQSQRIQDAREFSSEIERRVENELGLILDTSTDDTKIFELLMANESPQTSLSQGDIDDLVELIQSGTRAVVETGSYREAWGLLPEFFGDVSHGKFAIAENADSSRLSRYDLVIEKGSGAGTRIADETREAIEAMNRREREPLHSSYPQEDTSSESSIPAFGAVAAIAAGTVILATIGLCTFAGISIPVVGGLVGCGGGDTAGLTITSATVDGGTLTVNGTLPDTNDASNETTMNVTIHNMSAETVFHQEVVTVNATSDFSFDMNGDHITADLADDHNITVKNGDDEASKNITRAGPGTPEATPTATTPTPTAEPGESGDSVNLTLTTASFDGDTLLITGTLTKAGGGLEDTPLLNVTVFDEMGETNSSLYTKRTEVNETGGFNFTISSAQQTLQTNLSDGEHNVTIAYEGAEATKSITRSGSTDSNTSTSTNSRIGRYSVAAKNQANM